jgi:hypothetical protein
MARLNTTTNGNWRGAGIRRVCLAIPLSATNDGADASLRCPSFSLDGAAVPLFFRARRSMCNGCLSKKVTSRGSKSRRRFDDHVRARIVRRRQPPVGCLLTHRFVALSRTRNENDVRNVGDTKRQPCPVGVSKAERLLLDHKLYPAMEHDVALETTQDGRPTEDGRLGLMDQARARDPRKLPDDRSC